MRGHAENYDLDPSLLAAVIYTESRFNARAHSDAGAIGLMQLLPDTARGIAVRTGGNAFVVDDLYVPELNVRYGAWYLRNLLNRYGDERTALAAYHAGPGQRRPLAASRASGSSSPRRGATSRTSSTRRRSTPSRTRTSSGFASVPPMADPRDREYAELIVDGCLGVQPGWQVYRRRQPAGPAAARGGLRRRRAARRLRAAACLVRGICHPVAELGRGRPARAARAAGTAVRARARERRRAPVRRPRRTTRARQRASRASASAPSRRRTGRPARA